ncbi:MAG TPA: SusC/RagA family TonB-linked outer membrane protein [Puia sp.]|nr:SusC/RagA family TonB-linked outer membrane protein [Puia sp.]
MKFGYLKMWLLLVLLVSAAPAWAQVKKVAGKVTADEDGKPLAGVNVTVKNKNLGTQTNGDGEFVIQAAPGDVLVVSYTGYGSQEIKVSGGQGGSGSAPNLMISLKADAGKLGEVVVVGYGTQIRKNLTSAVAKLDKDVLANSPRANVGTALQGTVSGLQVVNATGQPGANPVILLRGGASINNPGAPLTVVDGTIRAYNDIPAEDIESIELLKDAAATAIYGARANNGVILISTKHGRSGKAQISYKYTAGYNKAREGYHFLNAKDFIYYNRLGNFNSGRTLAQVNSSRGYGLLSSAADLATFDIRQYGPTTAGLMGQGWDTVGDPYGGTIIFKDHGGEVQNLVFRNTHTQDHYLNVTGGNDKGTYFSSFDYYKEDGVIVGSGYKRFSGDLNGSYKVRPNVEISSGVSLSTSSQLGVNGSEVNSMYRNLALWPTFNPWLDSAKTLPNPGNGINDGNPLYWLGKQKRSDEVNRITVNAAVKWDILPGLFIKATGSGYLFEQLDQSFTKATQTYANVFANPPSFSSVSRPSVSTWQRSWQQQYNVLVNYSHSFGNHNLSAMVGSEYYDTKSYAMQVSGTLAPTDDIPTANASTTFAAGSNYSTTSEYRISSAFGRLNYDYDQKYLLSLVFRSDGVSSLASEHRWGFFPGMSAGWNVQREKFFTDAGLDRVVSTLKPRVSYGVNGNVAGLGNYEVQGTYALQGLYNGVAGFLNTGTINGNLRWEKSKTLDIGADIGLLHDRISLMFDYYKRNTSDLLTNLAVPDYTGFGSVRTNLGTFQNKGYELTVNANILHSPRGLKWDIGFNASFVKNKILKLPYNGQANNRQGGLQVYDPASKQVVWVGGLQEGQALGNIYAYKQVSIFKDDADIAKVAGNRIDVVAGISGPNATYGSGKITPGDVNWQDVDGNDTIDSRDQVYIGNIYPKWTGGFSTTLSYHGVSLYSRFEFATGHTIYNDYVARILGNYQGTFNYIDWQKKSWSPSNTVTDIPKVYYADQVSAPNGKKNYTRSNNANAVLNSNNSRFYEKGNYLACREITLSYDIPASWLHATRVLTRPARVYVSANNLFYITKFSGPSPEPPVTPGGSTINGIYQGTYPTPRSFVLGVQVSL